MGGNADIFAKVKRLYNFDLAANTTYCCGGKARVAYFPKDESEAAAVFSRLKENGERFFVLGGGSNVLAQDGMYHGAILCSAAMRTITYLPDGSLLCGAGVKVSELLALCQREGFCGLEYLAGIPATVGGIAYMNAGAGGKSISENVVYVRLFDGVFRNLSVEECDFTYKHSTMHDINCLICAVCLSVSRSTSEEVGCAIKERLLKRSSLPKGRSCGCVFKNHRGISAGMIIEAADLCGVRFGGAQVSCEHANFIISRGNRSADVYALIRQVKRVVRKRMGVSLDEEVCYIGDFE